MIPTPPSVPKDQRDENMKKSFLVQPIFEHFFALFPKETFLQNFQTFITNARIYGFFSKFPRLSFWTFFNTSKKFALD